jgi:hypothetical protein
VLHGAMTFSTTRAGLVEGGSRESHSHGRGSHGRHGHEHRTVKK